MIFEKIASLIQVWGRLVDGLVVKYYKSAKHREYSL